MACPRTCGENLWEIKDRKAVGGPHASPVEIVMAP